MKRSEIFFGIIRIPLDFLATVAAFSAAYFLRTKEQFYFLLGPPVGDIEPLNVYLRFAFFAACILLVIFGFEGMYSLKSTYRFRKEMRKILFLCASWFMALIAYFFIMRIQFFSRLILGYAFILTMLFVILSRIIIRSTQRLALAKNIGKRRLMFIGNNKVTCELYQQFAHNPSYRVIGIITEKNTETKSISMPEKIKNISFGFLQKVLKKKKHEEIKILGGVESLEEILQKNGVDEVIQTQSNIREETKESVLETCKVNHITYRFVPDILEVQSTNIELNFHKGIPIITLRETPLDAWGRVAKRMFDIIIALIAIIILSPIFIIIALFIKIDSRGPIIYRSKRVSAKGRIFNVFKFRSMLIDADKKKSELAHLNHRTGPLFKIKNDPRVTRFGKFIRKTSLDELPQLFNVIMGNMSLVGPRPHLIEEVAKYERRHRKVLAIKPGITGLAQISGRSDLDFEEEVKLDTYYIENWSLLLDIIILLKTIPAVLKGHAAD